MDKGKLIKLRCKAWGISETDYYINQCGDFSIRDMARAYRRGKNKGYSLIEEALKVFTPKNEMIDMIAYAIYYTANPDSKMCVPNCAYFQAEKMFKKYKEEQAHVKH